MSYLPASSSHPRDPNKALVDSQRDDASARVNEAFIAQDIDQDQYHALLDQVFAAKTQGDLVPVLDKLPRRLTHDEPAMVKDKSRLAPGELSEYRKSRLPMIAFGVGLAIAVLVGLLLIAAVL